MRAARILSAALLALASCTVGPDFVKPEPPKTDHYVRGTEPVTTPPGEGKTQRFDPNAKLPSNWWQLFKSPKLEPIVRDALQANATLEAARATLRQSQANLQAGKGVYYPQIDGNFSAARQKSLPVSVGVVYPSTIYNLFTLTGSISYVLDLFGANRRAVETLSAQTEAQSHSMLATYLSLTGNVVNTAIAAAAYASQIQATESMVRDQRDQVAVIQAQAEAGTTSYASLLSIQTQLAATEATLPPLRQKRAQAEHLLASLSGRLPSEAGALELTLDDLALPETLPRTLPSALVQQRPDILQSQALLHAASAQVGVATAALFPKLTLSGNYGVGNTALDHLFDSGTNFGNITADLTAPIFHGMTLRAQREAAIEAYRVASANYRQTVLTAFEQVADSLRALENDAGTVEAQFQAQKTAAEALSLIRTNYQAGTANYVQVLIATTQFDQARIAYLQSVAQRLQDTVALFVALGGGWWNPETPA